LKEVYSQELSSRIGEDTEFEALQLEGKIDKDVIKNIENAKNYFSDSKYRVIQAIIQDNKSKHSQNPPLDIVHPQNPPLDTVRS
jgi:hypothetical protein